MQWYAGERHQVIPMLTVEAKTANRDTFLTIWQTRSCISKQKAGSRTVGVLTSGDNYLLQDILCALSRI